MDSIVFKVVVILLLLVLLGSIAMGDRRIRKQRELEEREQRGKQAGEKSE